ncbi:MupG family TIM beta-alpha barrel fold protein [Williamsoniiplasma somnilux]|nr:MupG family TIM beta-alpha barrel fold protein [Williamsoniiplasma somnilux]
MFKKKIGISIYPEKNDLQKTLDYLELAKKYGYSFIFVSFIHMVNSSQIDIDKVLKAIKKAKELNYYVIADLEYESLKKINISINNLKQAKEYGIDCIRFDSPVLPKEIAALTHNKYGIDIQLNVSNNDSFIDNVLDYKPVLSRLAGCHNFYPQKYTGLEYDFFKESSQRYLSKGMSVGAFIGSHTGILGTAKYNNELPTLEMTRCLDVDVQAKVLFYSNNVDFVAFGNAFASEEELKKVSLIDREEITLSLELSKYISENEKTILFWDQHFRRGDVTKFFVRSTMSRVVFKNLQIPDNNTKEIFDKGDVVVINENGGSYKGELLIILQDNFKPENNTYNFLGKILKDEISLLNYIESWTYFQFSTKNRF